MSMYPLVCFQCGDYVDSKIRNVRSLITVERPIHQVIEDEYPSIQECCLEKLLNSIESVSKQVSTSAPIKVDATIQAMKFRVPATPAVSNQNA